MAHWNQSVLEFFRARILNWYRAHGRSYPWRFERDPYRVLIAERMLHRTRSDQVVPVYGDFVRRYPDVRALSAATPDEVHAMLAPLGLAWRHDTFIPMAQEIIDRHSGSVPDSLKELLALSGVGMYTAEAVLCFAFGRPVAIVDTNTIRVAGRYLHGVAWKGDQRRRRDVRQAVTSLIAPDQAADSNYGILDLAATVCLSGKPRCEVCPVAPHCTYRVQAGQQSGVV